MPLRSILTFTLFLSAGSGACLSAPEALDRAHAREEARDALAAFSITLAPPADSEVIGTVGLQWAPAVGQPGAVPTEPASAVEAWMDGHCEELLGPDSCAGETVMLGSDAAEPPGPGRHPCERWRDATRLSEAERAVFYQQCMERTAPCASRPAAEQAECAELGAFAHFSSLEPRLQAAYPTLFVDPTGALRFGQDLGGPVIAYMATRGQGAGVRTGTGKTLLAITAFLITSAILARFLHLFDEQEPDEQEDECARRIAAAAASVTAETGSSVRVVACCDRVDTFLAAPKSIAFRPHASGDVSPSTIMVTNVGPRPIAVANGLLETARVIPTLSSHVYRVEHDPGGSLWGYCGNALFRSGGISYFTER